ILMRQTVGGIFALIIGLAAAMVFVFITTLFVRGSFALLHAFVVDGIPSILRALGNDPWLVVALVIALLFLWSHPGGHGGHMPGQVRRGRKVTNVRTAPRHTSPTRTRIPPSSGARGRR